jgi:N-acetyl-gamma-glutamyl-phosphate reductase
MKQAAVIGGTGYGALELIRILERHPYIQINALISRSEEGEPVADRYPHLTTLVDEKFTDLKSGLLEKADIVFFATPAGVAKELLPRIRQHGVQYIDLSGDLRIDSPDEYEQWYGGEAPPKALQKESVYGMPEINSEKIKQAEIISNPGCFATAALLGIFPAVITGKASQKDIIIDGKTGVSGAGRKLSMMTHFSETNENIKAYKIGSHQHTPEIEQYLAQETSSKHPVSFQTHLIPMTRGIMCTCYLSLNDTSGLHETYEKFYENHPFVRIRPEGVVPQTKEVYGSNFCDIGISVDKRTGRLLVVSVIDNLVKGASGQAVQNMNLMNGWKESEGLTEIPLYP